MSAQNVLNALTITGNSFLTTYVPTIPEPVFRPCFFLEVICLFPLWRFGNAISNMTKLSALVVTDNTGNLLCDLLIFLMFFCSAHYLAEKFWYARLLGNSLAVFDWNYAIPLPSFLTFSLGTVQLPSFSYFDFSGNLWGSTLFSLVNQTFKVTLSNDAS